MMVHTEAVMPAGKTAAKTCPAISSGSAPQEDAGHYPAGQRGDPIHQGQDPGHFSRFAGPAEILHPAAEGAVKHNESQKMGVPLCRGPGAPR